MPLFSIAVTQHGWTAKNMFNDKILTGRLADLPDDVYTEIRRRTKMKDLLAFAGTVLFLEDGTFHNWFRSMHQSALSKQE